MPTITGRHFATQEDIRVRHEDGLIVEIEKISRSEEPRLPWIAPALVDLQINGIAGHEFLEPDLSHDDLNRMCKAIVATGVHGFLPTITTESVERITTALRNLADFAASDAPMSRSILGFHVEGPYISAEDGPRGAHPLAHCRRPNWDEFQRFQEAADGRIKILTMSPEYENSEAFIRQAVAAGICIAIGHTAANSNQIAAAVDAGASLSTHLGNGAHANIRRHPNYIWDQLAEDRLSATVIADGHHLPDSVLRCFYRSKAKERFLIVSDMTGMAGMPVGLHTSRSLGQVEVLEDGRLVVAGQREYLAGASRPLWDGVKQIMKVADLTLADAVAMAAQRPAQLINSTPPELSVGSRADLLIVEQVPPDSNEGYRLKTVLWGGQERELSSLVLDAPS